MRPAFSISLSLLAAVVFPLSHAAAASFKDVSASHPASAAIDFVKENGIMTGYDDGTFRPNQPIKRSETVKVLVATKMTPEQIATYTKRSFTDVAEDAWYRPYVEAAMQKLGIIDGPPKATEFHGEKTVKQVEFLKMLLKSQDIDAVGAFSEIKLPLSSDVTDTSAWYYPYLRYAVTSSLVLIGPDGKFKPDSELTRADAAQLIYRLAMYQGGRRTQALLSEEESELVNLLQMMEAKQLEQSEFASARALLAARGALQSKPSASIVQGAVKTAEAFRALVRAYRAGAEGRTGDVITLSKDAWNLAAKAKELASELDELSSRVQKIASEMAGQAREVQQQP